MMTNLKRGIALLLVLLLSITVFTACNNDENGNGEAVSVDEGLAPDTVVIEIVGGAPVLWEEMYYDLQMMRHQLEMFAGPVEDWDALFEDNPDGEVMTYHAFLIQYATDAALGRRAIESLFAELGETIEDSVFEEELEQYLEMFAVDEYGFAEILEEHHLTLALLRELTEVSHMQMRIAEEFADEENFDPAEIEAFVEEESVLRAKHILLMVPEFADEEEDAEILAEAMALYEELQDLSGDELFTRFDEMIAAYGEDPGMMTNPDGYTFMPGAMVDEFFDTTLATEINEVSEPVRSGFGYHIILRLPIDASADIMGPGGMQMTFGQILSAGRFERAMEEAREQVEYTIVLNLEELDFDALFAPVEDEEELEEDSEE